MLTKLAATLLAIACALAFTPAIFAQDVEMVDLAPGLDAGMTLRYRIESDTRQTMTSPLGEQTFVAEQVLTVRIEVDRFDQDGGVVKLIHEQMRVELKSDAFSGVFDSDQPVADDKDNRLARITRPLIDQPLTLNLDPDGEIRGVKGLENLAPGGLDGALFRQLYSEDAFKAMYHIVFRVKPAPTAVFPGQQWRLTEDRAGGGLTRTSRSYRLTFEKKTRDGARITFAGMNLEADESPAGPALEPVSFELEGHCVWDDDLGVLHSLESRESVRFAADADRGDFALTGETESRLTRLNASR